MKRHSLFGIMLLLIILPIENLLSQNVKKKNYPKLGLVLSGGGAKGFAHIGAIRVFEEAGLQFDFISGTSMGSIFGSLYALGYHPDTMEKIVRQQHWDNLMADKIDRMYIPIEEKQNSDRFLMTFPVVEKKVRVKTGLYTGQMVDLLLAKYLSPAYRTSDFKQLPTPFLCIGTDLGDGANVVLEKGVLHKAVRASMSIPSYFIPIVIDNHTLVDGGVINNFPVEEVKKRGADIIVGVDVQSGLAKIDEINSAFKVLDQVTSFYRIDANNKAMRLTDFYIKPNLEGYDMMSFTAYDSIIKRGEDAARAQLPALKRLADSLNLISPRSARVLDAAPLDSIFITEFRYEGLKMVSREYLDGALDIKPMSWIHLEEVIESVKRAYGSGFFELINFYFIPNEYGAGLVFEITEASSGIFGAGLHYDSDYKVGLLLNATFKNVLIKGSKLFADINLGENPQFKALYLVDRGRKIGFGLHASGLSLRLNSYNGNELGDVLKFNQYVIGAFAQWTYRNTMRLRVGARVESLSTNSGFGNPIFDNADFDKNFVAGALWSIDTYNRNYFSTTGHKMNFGIKYVGPIGNDSLELFGGKALIFALNYDKNFPVSKRSTIKTGLTAGVTFFDKYPSLTHFFFMGGQSNFTYFDGFIPFIGHRFVEQTGLNQVSMHAAWQYQIADKFYISPKINIGYIEIDIEDLFVKPELLVGYGVTFSYDSFVGPVELSLMGGNRASGMSTFVNIGYWF
ncbi:MAG TPA: patatin-like phospholipase family protein [Bacteroidales bacterium]|nr:patatin-like phospholipase family protein [Bacteroidales bacterium]